VRPQAIAANSAPGQGTRIRAETSSTALKCTIVGVAKAAPARCMSFTGFSAISVITTNCNPISAPAAEPTMT
jgi:hypothetical protein